MESHDGYSVRGKVQQKKQHRDDLKGGAERHLGTTQRKHDFKVLDSV